MFERFTEHARDVVVRAQEEADALGHNYIGTEHLLLGLLAGESDAARVLSSFGVTREGAVAEVKAIVGVGTPDAAALASIGIDLDEVRRRIEAAFGPGALERTRAGRRAFCGERPFTPRSKRALELAEKESRRLGHGRIGPEHVLLGLLAEGEGIAIRMLEAAGSSSDRIRAAVLDRLGRAA